MDILGMHDEQFKQLASNHKQVVDEMTYGPTMLQAASARYPFINQHNVHVVENPQEGRGFAETWFAGDEGAPQFPRPGVIPMDRHGIEIFRPKEFGIDDLAGEVMHLDPHVNEQRDALAASMTPEQVAALRRESLDYDESIRGGQSFERALQNATDGMIRGHVVNQWPASALESIKLNEEQKKILDGLHNYVRSGKKNND